MLRSKCCSILAATLAVLLYGSLSPAQAQDSLFVTGVSNPAAAWLQDADGTRFQLGTRDMHIGEIRQGLIGVASGQHLMLYAESGAAVLVFGPATLRYAPSADKNLVTLEEGRLLIAAVATDVDGKPLALIAPADSSGVAPLEADICPGLSYYERSGGTITAAYVAEAGGPPSMKLSALGRPRELGSGQMISVAGGQVQTGPAEDWIAKSQLDTTWGVMLGVASAQAARPALESTLFSNITAWDVYGGQKYVSGRLEAGRFRPEIRQVANTISTPQRSGTAPKGAPQTQGFPAANEVPYLSPAALSVINPTENVTAIQLNVQARNLLTATGSRGLGFRGLSRLAIAGTFGDGIPTIGPSGLGQ